MFLQSAMPELRGLGCYYSSLLILAFGWGKVLSQTHTLLHTSLLVHVHVLTHVLSYVRTFGGGIMEPDFDSAERRLLVRLWPDKKLWYRSLAGTGLADRPLRRSIRSLQKRGYIAPEEPKNRKRGQKKPFRLTNQGWIAAARLLVGKIDKDSGPFLQILERVKQISEMPEDEGEGVTPLAIDIANILNKENSKKVRDILYTLINELK